MLYPTDRFATERIFSAICYGFTLNHARCIEDHDYLRQFVHTVTQIPNLEVGKIEYLADYRPNVRVVNTFQQGRVFIAGDAAHVHPISGGQGMNSSVMDAFNLGWKLALAAKGQASASLLDSYTAERLPVIKEMLQHTTAVARHGFDKLGVHYRWSPIVVDEDLAGSSSSKQAAEEIVSTYVVKEGDRLHAGDRAHDAVGLVDIRSGETKRLFDLFRPTHHTVLIFSHSGEDATPIVQLLGQYPTGSIYSAVIFGLVFLATAEVQGADASLVDERGHAYATYGAQTGTTSVAIVRPDGVVGALVKGSEGVERYFSLVFAS
ncbi:hypothetical protein EWM64_g823 [Hericium alpestre]|uniref:FAD-binding domain-containing protein n=1 Tax=Hericium alpestre TaxID=135208 RepID=A0A4Z0A8Y0_9AGAM|nr:hypothetical protein EWM64_g823 [Hericium alpestre]